MIPLTGLNDKHLLNTLAENRNMCYLGQTQQDPFRKALHLKIIFILLVSDPTHTKCIHLLVIMQHAACQKGQKKNRETQLQQKGILRTERTRIINIQTEGQNISEPLLTMFISISLCFFLLLDTSVNLLHAEIRNSSAGTILIVCTHCI